MAAVLGVGCGSSSGIEDSVGSNQQAVSAAYDWLQFFGDSQHSGNNTLETQLTAQNVAGLKPLFRVSLPASADSAPVVVTNVAVAGTIRDVAFVTTQAGHLIAFDARTGVTLWSKLNTGSNFTTSSPVIDPSRAFVYAYGLDGKIHKYAVATGAETTSGGWPAIATIKPQFEKGITSLSLVSTGTNNFLSVGFSGYGDFNDYQGHLTTVNLASGAQTVFNANCSNQAVHFTTGGSPDCATTMSAIWGRSGAVYSQATGRVYAGTGNGTFDPANHLWGDTVIALNPDGTGQNGNPLDTYTPSVFQSLQDQDFDLGSASPAILPNSGTKYPHLALQAGKDNKLRLLNLDNLSGQGGPGHVGGEVYSLTLPQLGDVTASMPVWTNPADNSTWVFVISTGASGGLTAFKLLLDASGNPSLGAMWQQTMSAGTALLANQVLYRATAGRIAALNPATGATLWSDTSIGSVHWHSPVVVNGILYITDKSSRFSAYSLQGASLAPLSRAGWVASASATDGTDVAGRALDGDVNTRFTSGQPQQSSATQSFTVDMQSAQTFSQITLDSDGGDFARNYQLFASNDPNNWGAALSSGSSGNALTLIAFPQTTARYLQVRETTATGVGSWWSIHEFNVFSAVYGASRARVFDAGDNNPAAPSEWDFGVWKGDCGGGAALTGLSQAPNLSAAHSLLCASQSVATGNAAATIGLTAGDQRRAQRSGDWDAGFVKAECGANEYVSGASMDPSTRRLHALRCAQGSGLTNGGQNNCETRRVTADDRGTSATGDWASGYFKAECSLGKVVFGVSVDAGHAHKILCCDK